MDEDFETGIKVITIVFDPMKYAPEIDLGGLPPYFAMVVFGKAMEALEASIPYPTIYYNDEIIATDMMSGEDLDDD